MRDDESYTFAEDLNEHVTGTTATLKNQIEMKELESLLFKINAVKQIQSSTLDCVMFRVFKGKSSSWRSQYV
jgi:hypothetical protein